MRLKTRTGANLLAFPVDTGQYARAIYVMACLHLLALTRAFVIKTPTTTRLFDSAPD